jgi:hypothetical protein
LEDGNEINRHQIGIVFFAFCSGQLSFRTFVSKGINPGLGGGINAKSRHTFSHFGGEQGPKRIQKMIKHVYAIHAFIIAYFAQFIAVCSP